MARQVFGPDLARSCNLTCEGRVLGRTGRCEIDDDAPFSPCAPRACHQMRQVGHDVRSSIWNV